MIDSYFRSSYQRFIIDPLLRLRQIHLLSPLKATTLGLLFGMTIPILLFFKLSYWAALFLLASGFFDTLDGSLARHKNAASPRGAAFDIVADRVVEWAILLGLYLFDPAGRGYVTLFMLGSVYVCITTFLVVGIFHNNTSEKSFHYSPGLIERSEAFFFFFLMILIPSFFAPLALLFGSLTFLTAFIRMKQFFRNHQTG